MTAHLQPHSGVGCQGELKSLHENNRVIAMKLSVLHTVSVKMNGARNNGSLQSYPRALLSINRSLRSYWIIQNREYQNHFISKWRSLHISSDFFISLSHVRMTNEIVFSPKALPVHLLLFSYVSK